MNNKTRSCVYRAKTRSLCLCVTFARLLGHLMAYTPFAYTDGILPAAGNDSSSVLIYLLGVSVVSLINQYRPRVFYRRHDSARVYPQRM